MRIKLHAIIFTLIDNQVYRIICYITLKLKIRLVEISMAGGNIWCLCTEVICAGSDSGCDCGIQFQVEMQIFDIKQMSEHRRERVETCLHDEHVCNTLNG